MYGVYLGLRDPDSSLRDDVEGVPWGALPHYVLTELKKKTELIDKDFILFYKIQQKIFFSNRSIWVPKKAEFYADSKTKDKIERKKRTQENLFPQKSNCWL